MPDFTSIHERLDVAGVFSVGGFIPKKFLWRGKTHFIKEITMKTDMRDGGVRLRMFSVLAGGTLYRLLYNRDLEQWWLEEVWVE